jgi:hypothetical protein
MEEINGCTSAFALTTSGPYLMQSSGCPVCWYYGPQVINEETETQQSLPRPKAQQQAGGLEHKSAR